MKKLFTMFFAVLLALSVEAENGLNTNPKVTNYEEVVKRVKYPMASREAGAEGLVTVKLLIDENGKVLRSTFMQYPDDDLKLAVEKILNEFTFVAAVDENGNATKGEIIIPIKFRLTI